jgi:NitT/TauT family transport system substrate-binding protein
MFILNRKFSNKKRYLKIVWLILSVALIISISVLPGCKAKEVEKVHLKVGILPFISASPLYIAFEEGFFAKQGLEIEFVSFTTAAQLVPLLSQGELDAYAASMNPAFINAAAQGMKVKIVAGREYNSGEGVSSALVVRKDLFDSGEINTVEEVKGRKVAVSAVGTISHFTLSQILKEANMTLNDVQVSTDTSQNALAAFQNHALDLSTLGPPQLQQAVNLNYGVVLDSLNRIMPGFQSGFLMFGPNLLDKNQEAADKFLIAYLQGIAQYNQGKTTRNMEIIEKYLQMDQAALEKTFWTPIYIDGRIQSDDIVSWQTFFMENKLIDKTVTIDKLINTKYVENARGILKQK